MLEYKESNDASMELIENVIIKDKSGYYRLDKYRKYKNKLSNS